MGMRIFETNGTFSPSDYGLVSGDAVDVICVGGGSSGETSGTNGTPSVSGGNSTFGTYVSSANGITMAKGETPADNNHAGCGAGGYMPGVPFYGGNGGSPVGMAGTAETPVSPYCNPGGPGNKGATGGYIAQATSGDLFAPAGNGYGAGGGGSRTGNAGSYSGGDAGRIAFGSVVLESTTGISVTVGAGGVNAGNSSRHGAPGVVIVFW